MAPRLRFQDPRRWVDHPDHAGDLLHPGRESLLALGKREPCATFDSPQRQAELWAKRTAEGQPQRRAFRMVLLVSADVVEQGRPP